MRYGAHRLTQLPAHAVLTALDSTVSMKRLYSKAARPLWQAASLPCDVAVIGRGFPAEKALEKLSQCDHLQSVVHVSEPLITNVSCHKRVDTGYYKSDFERGGAEVGGELPMSMAEYGRTLRKRRCDVDARMGQRLQRLEVDEVKLEFDEASDHWELRGIAHKEPPDLARVKPKRVVITDDPAALPLDSIKDRRSDQSSADVMDMRHLLHYPDRLDQFNADPSQRVVLYGDDEATKWMYQLLIAAGIRPTWIYCGEQSWPALLGREPTRSEFGRLQRDTLLSATVSDDGISLCTLSGALMEPATKLIAHLRHQPPLRQQLRSQPHALLRVDGADGGVVAYRSQPLTSMAYGRQSKALLFSRAAAACVPRVEREEGVDASRHIDRLCDEAKSARDIDLAFEPAVSSMK